MTLFLVVLRELALAELNAGPDVLVDVLPVLARALPTVLRPVFVALLTLRLRDDGLPALELDDRFPPLGRGLVDVELFLRMLADLAPLDTLAVLASLLLRLPRPRPVFIAASFFSISLAPSLAT
ncbi:MAG TPA: hypothetical protein VFY40_06510 [Blastocatellia bacterium]|nr:hypothetical protein [Blastocatellia bacterium]